MKYIDSEKLIAEIDRRISIKENLAQRPEMSDMKDSLQDIISAYQSLKTFAASLQQEQPEVDLEKAFAHEYAIYHLPTFIIASIVDGTELIDFIYKTARHFYELGLNARKEDEK